MAFDAVDTLGLDECADFVDVAVGAAAGAPRIPTVDFEVDAPIGLRTALSAVEGVGEALSLKILASEADVEITGLLVTVLVRRGARVVDDALGGSADARAVRGAGTGGGAVVVVGRRAPAVLALRVELRALVVVVEGLAAGPVVVDAPKGLRTVVEAALEAGLAPGATDARGPAAEGLVDVVEVLGAAADVLVRVAGVAVVLAAPTRGLASDVTLALGFNAGFAPAGAGAAGGEF